MADPPFFFPKDYADHERHVVQHADYFVACRFTGRATYAKDRAKTLQGAKRKASAMIQARPPTDMVNKGRPVLVYAVKGVHQVVAALVEA